jgi:hypothetical protein
MGCSPHTRHFTAQGQLPIGSVSAAAGVAPIPPNRVAVRLLTDAKDKDLFLASGAYGAGAVYTDVAREVQILRKVFVRVTSKLNWLILKLHLGHHAITQNPSSSSGERGAPGGLRHQVAAHAGRYPPAIRHADQSGPDQRVESRGRCDQCHPG